MSFRGESLNGSVEVGVALGQQWQRLCVCKLKKKKGYVWENVLTR